MLVSYKADVIIILSKCNLSRYNKAEKLVLNNNQSHSLYCWS